MKFSLSDANPRADVLAGILARQKMSGFALLVTLAMAGLIPAEALGAAPADGNPRTAYFTTGDLQDLLTLPLDSKASIEAAIDALHTLYGVESIWWRGGQDEVWGKQFIFRPGNRSFDRVWDWWKYLAYEKVGTNRIAVSAAHHRGMKIWMAYGLFDNGSGPDVGYSGFPYTVEDRLRVSHPEYVPINRWGTWRQGGPIEFAYAGARKEMVEYLTKYTVQGGYDGIAFLTYAENYSQRYDDEFGFSPPVVAEFRKRHGIDIRKQMFNKDVWSRLRGEYLTQFFRELRAAFAKEGKKIAVCVDGTAPDLPVAWNGVKDGLRSAGLIHLDIATWAREGLVDEINVYAPSTDAAIQHCLGKCKGTRTVVSVFRTRGPMPPGAPRVMFLGSDLESGFPFENYIDYSDEKVPHQPETAMKNGDIYARRRLLTAVIKKKQRIPIATLIGATKDSDLYVRRRALQALAITGDPSGIPAVEAALRDVEHSVRWQAALAIGDLAGRHAIEPLFDMVARDPISFQMRFRVLPEVLKKLQSAGKLAAKDKEPIVARLTHSDPAVREAALYAFKLVGAPATSEVETAMLKILEKDPSAYARDMAIENLQSSFGPTAVVLVALRAAMRDRDEAVQVRALAARARMLSSGRTDSNVREKALDETSEFFRRYGDGCSRADKDWGWRIAGAAIRDFGADGEKLLNKIMKDKRDRRLADISWRVLYLEQGDNYHRVSMAEDQKAHAMYPFLSNAIGK